MMFVFINIFRDTIKCQFPVGTVKYSRNNLSLYWFNPSLFVNFCLFHFFCGYVYLNAAMLQALVVQTT
jgi:hypothetical protein